MGKIVVPIRRLKLRSVMHTIETVSGAASQKTRINLRLRMTDNESRDR